MSRAALDRLVKRVVAAPVLPDLNNFLGLLAKRPDTSFTRLNFFLTRDYWLSGERPRERLRRGGATSRLLLNFA
jgi:hypothetical protein